MKTLDFELESEQSSPSLDGDELAKLPDRPQGTPRERPWFMSVSLATRPRCFGCGGRMLPKVVVFSSGFAICELCSYIDWSKFTPTWLAIESLGCAGELSRSRGIVFWTPPGSLPDIDAYLRWAELWEIMARTGTKESPPNAPPSKGGCQSGEYAWEGEYAREDRTTTPEGPSRSRKTARHVGNITHPSSVHPAHGNSG